MKREDLTEKLLDIKRENAWTWKYICEKIGGYSEVLPRTIVGAVARTDEADEAAGGQCRRSSCRRARPRCSTRCRCASRQHRHQTDPLIYRFYEMVMVNGPAWKALIEEEFGDRIMSALDFDMGIERVAGRRATASRSRWRGKFLPYKYYGTSGCGAGYGGFRRSEVAHLLEACGKIAKQFALEQQSILRDAMDCLQTCRVARSLTLRRDAVTMTRRRFERGVATTLC